MQAGSRPLLGRKYPNPGCDLKRKRQRGNLKRGYEASGKDAREEHRERRTKDGANDCPYCGRVAHVDVWST